MKQVFHHSKRAIIALVGGVVIIVGIIAIPYPGPGWLIVFAGLGILATEFEWARRLLRYAKDHYNAWTEWVKRQSRPVRYAIIAGVAFITIMTIYLMNGYGIISDLLHLEWQWAHSPLSF
jgi:uncharacterized protein (TIGR02611 family)